MPEISLADYSEAVSAAFELVEGDRQSNQERVDRALTRLRMLFRQSATPAAVGLTSAQAELLFYIETFIGKHGHSPSFREMRAALGYASLGEVHRLVACLIERGRVQKLERRARAISVIQPLTILDAARVASRISRGAA